MKTALGHRRGLFYRLSSRYLHRADGNNDDALESNGELRLIRKVLPRCRRVFDVGANVGDWARLALEVNPRLDLHCFEPSLATFNAMTRGGDLATRAVCNNFGLSSSESEAELLVFTGEAGVNSLYERRGVEAYGLDRQNARERITLRTFDAYCAERHVDGPVDFCKIDVEGHELEVLRGMKHALADGRVRLIQFEYGGCNIDSRVLLRDLFEWFEPFRYSLYKIYPGELRLAAAYDQRLENFQYQNWLAVSPAAQDLVAGEAS